MNMSDIIAALIIIIGSGYIGIVYASRYDVAVNQIGGFINAFKMLEFDISFLKLPLFEAFERIYESQTGTVKKVFKYMTDSLSEKKCSNIGNLFVESLEKYKKELVFSDEVKSVLTDFSKSLGEMNVENEISNIKAAYTKLKYFEEEARNISGKNAKMCRGLGFLTGIFIVTILC